MRVFRNWKRYFEAVIIIVCMIIIGGCSKKEEQECVEITLVHGYGGTLESYKMMQEIYNGFSEKNPDIKLNCIEYMNNEIAVEKANDMLAVGEIPDIVSTNSLSYYVDNAIKAGMALNLMPYLEADPEWKRQIHPSVFETWETDDGRIYTIPDALELSGYWYDKKYLEEAGVLDKEGNISIPKTWDDFMNMVEKLQNWIDQSGQDISVFSLEEEQLTEFLFLARLAGDGQSGLASAQDPVNGINKEAVEHVVADLARLNQYSCPVENIESARQRFIEGKTVIYFNGVWESEALEQSKLSDDYDCAAYPSNDGRSISYVSPPSGYVLAKQQDKKKEEACIRFLKYMLSDEVQKRIVLETGQAPCNPKIGMNDLPNNVKLLSKAVDAVNKGDEQIKTITSAWEYDKWKVVDDYLEQSMSNGSKLNKMLEELDAK